MVLRGQTQYLFHSEGPDDVLRQQLCLDQRHLDVSVDLSVIWPVFAALHLEVTKRSVFFSSSFLTLKASCSSNCMELKATKALTFAWTCCTGVAETPFFSLSHIVAHHYLPPGTHVSKPFLSSQKKREEICLIACSTRHRGSAANGNPAYR